MRFVFHNPHTLIWYRSSFYQFIKQLKSPDKYEHLFNWFYCDANNYVYVYIDNASSIPPFTGVFNRLSTPLIEFYTWVLINKLDPSRFKVIRNIETLMDQDVLMTFIYEHFTNLSGK